MDFLKFYFVAAAPIDYLLPPTVGHGAKASIKSRHVLDKLNIREYHILNLFLLVHTTRMYQCLSTCY